MPTVFLNSSFWGQCDAIYAAFLVAAFLLAGCLALSIAVENSSEGFFWGKVFVVDASTGRGYDSPGAWLLGMCGLYGYFAATSCLLAAMKHRRMRMPALVLQVLTLIYVGWQQTGFLAV